MPEKTIQDLITDAETLFNDIDAFHAGNDFAKASPFLREARAKTSIALGQLNNHAQSEITAAKKAAAAAEKKAADEAAKADADLAAKTSNPAPVAPKP